ncbi:MAG: zinc-binding dehydrogenase [Pseudobacteriovorax sp.]|nr:zinc-binding dehydrogenase [Pseudobacteriovorax sp.]
MKKMKTIQFSQFGSVDVLKAKEERLPAVGESEVLIQNHFASVNFVDVLLRQGAIPIDLSQDGATIPGVEGSGTVAAVGSQVKGLEIGDPVAWFGQLGVGGYSDYTVLPWSSVVKLSRELRLEQAAAIPVNYMTALNVLSQDDLLAPFDWILVHAAAGGVGTAITQLAKNKGLRVIATASANKHSYVLEQRAEIVFDYADPNIITKIQDLTRDRGGLKLSLNSIGGDTWLNDISLLAPFGRLVSYGFLQGMPSSDVLSLMFQKFSNSISLQFSDIYTLMNADPIDFQIKMGGLFKLFEANEIQPRIDNIVDLEQANIAHKRLETRCNKGKILLKCCDTWK